jgi:hypothetical protein
MRMRAARPTWVGRWESVAWKRRGKSMGRGSWWLSMPPGSVMRGVVVGARPRRRAGGGGGGLFGALGLREADGFHGLTAQDGALLVGGAEGGAGGGEFVPQGAQRLGARRSAFGVLTAVAAASCFSCRRMSRWSWASFSWLVADLGGFVGEEAA